MSQFLIPILIDGVQTINCIIATMKKGDLTVFSCEECKFGRTSFTCCSKQ